MSDLELLPAHLGALLSQLSDANRRKVMMAVARKLRQSQSKRIGQNLAPDGAAYPPRKNTRKKHGKVRGKMFQKLKTAKSLKIETDAKGLSVGFNQGVSKVAWVHQDGLTDTVRTRYNTIHVRYAKRVLLGFTDADTQMVEDEVLKMLAEL